MHLSCTVHRSMCLNEQGFLALIHEVMFICENDEPSFRLQNILAALVRFTQSETQFDANNIAKEIQKFRHHIIRQIDRQLLISQKLLTRTNKNQVMQKQLTFSRLLLLSHFNGEGIQVYFNRRSSYYLFRESQVIQFVNWTNIVAKLDLHQ